MYPAKVLGTFPFRPTNRVIYMVSAFYSYMRSHISVVSFLVLGLPLMYPLSIASLASSSPQFLPLAIHALKHKRAFSRQAGLVYLRSFGISASKISGLSGSFSII